MNCYGKYNSNKLRMKTEQIRNEILGLFCFCSRSKLVLFPFPIFFKNHLHLFLGVLNFRRMPITFHSYQQRHIFRCCFQCSYVLFDCLFHIYSVLHQVFELSFCCCYFLCNRYQTTSADTSACACALCSQPQSL